MGQQRFSYANSEKRDARHFLSAARQWFGQVSNEEQAVGGDVVPDTAIIDADFTVPIKYVTMGPPILTSCIAMDNKIEKKKTT